MAVALSAIFPYGMKSRLGFPLKRAQNGAFKIGGASGPKQMRLAPSIDPS
jgi:hypothetical protein